MPDSLICTACKTKTPDLESYFCASCWGPLAYSRNGSTACTEASDGIWRFASLLPSELDPLLSFPVGDTPLLPCPRLAAEWGVSEVWVKNETANPTHSFKDRVVAVALARARFLGLSTLACTSTGNLGHALASAAAAAGLEAVVLCPASVEPSKTAAARALGARVIPIEGSYDDVNRLAHLLADRLDWGWVNMTLRPFYAEGSKTLIWEVLREFTPTDVVAPLASGSLFSKLYSGSLEVGASGITFHGGQPEGCNPIFRAFASGSSEVTPVKACSRAQSLAIGTPADGEAALSVARASGGQVVSVPEQDLPQGVALLGSASGVLTESAGAVTVLAGQALAEQGAFSPDARVVLVITGDGLKGLDLVEDAAPQVDPLPASPDAVLACLS